MSVQLSSTVLSTRIFAPHDFGQTTRFWSKSCRSKLDEAQLYNSARSPPITRGSAAYLFVSAWSASCPSTTPLLALSLFFLFWGPRGSRAHIMPQSWRLSALGRIEIRTPLCSRQAWRGAERRIDDPQPEWQESVRGPALWTSITDASHAPSSVMMLNNGAPEGTSLFLAPLCWLIRECAGTPANAVSICQLSRRIAHMRHSDSFI